MIRGSNASLPSFVFYFSPHDVVDYTPDNSMRTAEYPLSHGMFFVRGGYFSQTVFSWTADMNPFLSVFSHVCNVEDGWVVAW